MRVSSTFCPPRDVINVAKSMNNHCLGISTSKHDITYLISQKFKYKSRMSTQMHAHNKHKGQNINDGQYDNGYDFKAL